MKTAAFGTCLFDKPILRRLSRLWQGPVTPEDLQQIEKGLRAFIMYERLAMANCYDVWATPLKGYGTYGAGELDTHDLRHPFDDEENLNYEFIEFAWDEKVPDLEPEEESFLRQFVLEKLREEVAGVLPKHECREWQLYQYVDAWYESDSVRSAKIAMTNSQGRWAELSKIPNLPDTPEEIRNTSFRLIAHPSRADIEVHAAMHLGPAHHAKYFVEMHSKGYGLCSTSVISRIANEHIFSKWPDHLFNQLEVDFRNEVRYVLGPGYAIPLPPLLSIVLSEARNREAIPETLIALRHDFEKARSRLWTLLSSLWMNSSYKEQVSIHRELEEAGKAIYPAAFPAKFDALSFSYAMVSNPKGSVKELLARDAPNRLVRAVSFAHLLSKHLKQIVSQRVLFKRHFSQSELRDFGIL